MRKLQRLKNLYNCQKNQKSMTRLHLTCREKQVCTINFRKVYFPKNKLIFYPSQFPSNSKKFKVSKRDLSVAATASTAWRTQNLQPPEAAGLQEPGFLPGATARCSEERISQHCMKAVDGGVTRE